MLLELTLYLLIGFVVLLFKEATTLREVGRSSLFVVFWPYFLLLKYVSYIDQAKQNSRRR
ncbi:hypothetical protein M3181_03780 [Mesobacillus maritimus]|uniref:hypothetical protein n=1 Tax=Mesobacillus maritimus TaxID=1643336 RepID=UPI00203E004A|nr:hypothetical protein [Mesobacillus maritimus]MCM3668120.1 hypothetical protein [Mesobacillus maritimus]